MNLKMLLTIGIASGKSLRQLNDMYYNIALNREPTKTNGKAPINMPTMLKNVDHDSLITLLSQDANGKWDHMMDQTHIGYTSWQEPRFQRTPVVKYVPKDSIQAEPVMTVSKPETAIYPKTASYPLFYEQDKYVSINADHFSKAINSNGIQWKILPNLGRTGSSVTPFPVTAKAQKPGGNAPHLEYEFYTYSKDAFTINTFFSPSLNFQSAEDGLQYAISVDDEAPQIISLNKEDKTSSSGIWNRWVGDNIIIKNTKHTITNTGKHTLKFWMVNPGVVLQKLVLDFGGLKPSYLGPLETIKN